MCVYRQMTTVLCCLKSFKTIIILCLLNVNTCKQLLKKKMCSIHSFTYTIQCSKSKSFFKIFEYHYIYTTVVYFSHAASVFLLFLLTDLVIG